MGNTGRLAESSVNLAPLCTATTFFPTALCRNPVSANRNRRSARRRNCRQNISAICNGLTWQRGRRWRMRWPNRTPHVLTQVWLVRRDTIGRNGMLRRFRPPWSCPGWLAGPIGSSPGIPRPAGKRGNGKRIPTWLKLDVPPFSANVALAIRRT
jgi:hypothetical protein